MKPNFSGKLEDIHLKGPGWGDLRNQSMDVTISKLEFLGGARYFELSTDYKSIKDGKNTKDIYCSI